MSTGLYIDVWNPETFFQDRTGSGSIWAVDNNLQGTWTMKSWLEYSTMFPWLTEIISPPKKSG